MGKIVVSNSIKWVGIHLGLCEGGRAANDCRLIFIGVPGIQGIINPSQYPVSAVSDDLRFPRPGYTGFSHYKFVDSFGVELAYIGASSAGYRIIYIEGVLGCTSDSCRVDCAGQPDGFCCIDHSLSNRLLQVLANL